VKSRVLFDGCCGWKGRVCSLPQSSHIPDSASAGASFALLFFAPDIAFAAYWAGPRIGAIVYNALHSTVGPIALAMAASMPHARIPPALAILWLAHIGFDRALGYGLKYSDGFVFTHLGNIGKQRQS
jgi:hypothetical protein